MIKKIIKKFTPRFIISWYHLTLAYLAMLYYGNPSNKLIVIGVTGTNGKSSTVNLISTILEKAGFSVGSCSTIEFKIKDQVWLNNKKMTMLGRFELQKMIKKMVANGCQYAVIETSSEGIKQYRHWGINYDAVVFTNLTPEHLESHGGFENYKKTKSKLFQHLMAKPKKTINGKIIPKISIINIDDEHADYFLQFKADQKITYSLKKPSDYQAINIQYNTTGTIFSLQSLPRRLASRSVQASSILNPKSSVLSPQSSFNTNLIGEFNLYNALSAIATVQGLGINLAVCQQALEQVKQIPGRLEFIETNKDFQVLIDYAPEPASMTKLYETLKLFNFHKIIHVLGSAGGGRDKSRRPILGELAIKNAEIIIVTNEDPYDEDPKKIIDQVAEGAKNYLKTVPAKDSLPTKNDFLPPQIYKILDRRAAIAKALSLAHNNDLVLITGKGSEQAMCLANGQMIPWDDRMVVQKILKLEN